MEFVDTGWSVRKYSFPHRSAHKLLSNTGTLDVRRSLNMTLCMHGSIKPRRKSQSHEVVVVDTGTANCLADRVSSADTNLRAYGVNKSEYFSSSESATAWAGRGHSGTSAVSGGCVPSPWQRA